MLIAETGGLNAMIVDSTALPEQAVDDIVASSFQSAGQRCSALRMLYVQEDTKDRVVEMLMGAMETLVTGDPWSIDTDVAPVIDAEAQADISAYVDAQDWNALIADPDTVVIDTPDAVLVTQRDGATLLMFYDDRGRRVRQVTPTGADIAWASSGVAVRPVPIAQTGS